jgi:hypothetical protein
MTEAERGSDAQMTPEQREETEHQAELARAAELEEDRKTQAQPADGCG